MVPVGVAINPATGAVAAATARYRKHLSEFRGVYRDGRALAARLAAEGDVVTYEVAEVKPEGSDIFFGTTTIHPGTVGGEYHMTRGHFHARPDRAEVYYTQSGEGLLLLESRTGETRTVGMRPGVAAYIPPDWAHRSINTGSEPLVFVWMTTVDAGHDYGTIANRGMRKLVVEKDGKAEVVDNPDHAG
jgi:glucose-6-phosphate isomerase